jgi:hypothetical protein
MEYGIPIGDVVVESNAHGRTGGGPIEPSTVHAGFMVVGVGTLLLVVLGSVVTLKLIQMLLPNAVTYVAITGGSSAIMLRNLEPY